MFGVGASMEESSHVFVIGLNFFLKKLFVACVDLL
jgi:hypothetical protein